MRSASWAMVVPALVAMGGCDLPDMAPPSGIRAIMADSADIAAASSDYSAPVDLEALIGLRHPPLPAGVEDLAGSVVRSSPRVAGHHWVLYSVRVGGRPLLLLSRPVGSNVQSTGPGSSVSRPIHEVVDAEPLPPLGPDERLSLTWCSDTAGNHVAAYVRWNPVSRGRPDPRVAWLPDLAAGALLEIDAGTVQCRGPDA